VQSRWWHGCRVLGREQQLRDRELFCGTRHALQVRSKTRARRSSRALWQPEQADNITAAPSASERVLTPSATRRSGSSGKTARVSGSCAAVSCPER
jgi:hypothetical protein